MICELYLPCMSSTSIVVKVHVSYVFNCMASDNCLQVKSQLCTSKCVCICGCVLLHACICVHLRVCVCVCVCVCACIYVYIS